MLENIAHIAATCATIFAAVVLALNIKAFKRESLDSHAKLFNEISNRINQVIDQRGSFKEGLYEKDCTILWFCNILGALEYLAFFVNRGYLPFPMAEYYRSYVVDYCDDVPDYPDVYTYLKGRPEDELSELKTLYKTFTGKNVPWV